MKELAPDWVFLGICPITGFKTHKCRLDNMSTEQRRDYLNHHQLDDVVNQYLSDDEEE